MQKKYRNLFSFLIFLFIAFGSLFFFFREDIAVLNPQGIIALKERNIIIISILLMLIVVLPVLIIAVLFAWKYRANNLDAKYMPEWDYSFIVEAVWWGIPFVIIFILSWITWNTSHDLDPFKPIDSEKKPLTIQVVALQWKWLFIYPEQNIATINFFQIPEKTPIHFELTADAPMNSFWIPQLSGQIYTMPGMNSKLNIVADAPGEYRGSSANLSGKGFAGMFFTAKASSEEEFQAWVKKIQQSNESLSLKSYKKIAEPSENNPIATFALQDRNLFHQILMKYMMPNHEFLDK